MKATWMNMTGLLFLENEPVVLFKQCKGCKGELHGKDRRIGICQGCFTAAKVKMGAMLVVAEPKQNVRMN